MIGAGYYGKLPARGDFITRGLGRQFVEPWDRFLAEGLCRSQEMLGDAWLETYLISPVWRFALGRHLCGEEAILGLFLPSVDAAGRYFPFTVAAPLTAGTPPLALLDHASGWHEKAEQLARAALAEGGSLSELDQAVDHLKVPPQAAEHAPGRRFAHADPAVRTALLQHIASEHARDYALFWTVGSDAVRPSVLLSPHLPPAQRFVAFLDGRFDEGGWIEEAA